MPPLTREQKQELMNKAEIFLTSAKLSYTPEEKERLLGPTEKDDIHQMAIDLAEYREKVSACSQKYKDIKTLGFERMAMLFLDTSDTPEADKKNREFLMTLTTDEGCAKFAKTCAGEILSLDLGKCNISDDIGENIRRYAANSRAIELGWVVRDLLNEKEEYLEPEVRQALIDREHFYQATADYQYCCEAAANDFYTVLPDLSKKEVDRLTSAETETDYEQFDVDTQTERQFSRTVRAMESVYIHTDDEMGKNIRFIGELSDDGKVSVYTVAKDKNGDRIPLDDAAKQLRAGKTVSFTREPAAKEVLDKYIAPAQRSIERPTEENRALFDNFGDKALSAQGKGFKAECARLFDEMEKAKLWYTGGSEEFKNIRRILKETAAGDNMPNREQSMQIMDEVLRNCEKYVAKKDRSTLKPNELKRLEAVETVRNSLLEKKHFLSEKSLRAEADRFASEFGAPDRARPFHASERNQALYHTTEGERSANAYIMTLRPLKGENGVMRQLALDTEQTVKAFGEYAKDVSEKANIMKYLGDDGVARSLAKIALMEMVRSERALMQKGGAEDKGMIETRLETMYADRENSNAYNAAIVEVAGTASVQKVTALLRESPANAAEFLTGGGHKKLLADVKAELKQKYAPEAKEEEVQKQVSVPGRSVKTTPAIDPPHLNVPGC